ncbi:MAG: cation diffusion facilitator family transporter [Planctomycetota bacterium]|nr:cation diffusion facilitator family transporter [Planctomycetota bacterium]
MEEHGHDLTNPVIGNGVDRAMAIGVVLNLGFVIVEAVFGVISGSLALLADAGHNASDVLGLLLAWGADYLARRPPTRKYTWGLRRSTIYAAFLNAVLLLVACGGILWEAWHRFTDPQPVAGPTMIVVAFIGVVINTLTAILFIRGHHDANIRGAFLHMAADAAISLGVVVAGIMILFTGLDWIDPVVSIAIMLVIVVGTWGLFRESVDLALDAVPRGIDINALEAALSDLPGVVSIHDLHVWGASTSEASLTVHLAVTTVADPKKVLAAAKNVLRKSFRITHVTIQIEDATPPNGVSAEEPY